VKTSCIFLNSQLGEYLFQFSTSREVELAELIIQHLRTWVNLLDDETEDIAQTVSDKHFIEKCEGFFRLDFVSSEVGFINGYIVVCGDYCNSNASHQNNVLGAEKSQSTEHA
jgi:hypothetical protein